MKTTKYNFCLLLTGLLVLVGCSSPSKNPFTRPPTVAETQIYTIETNQVVVTPAQTNIVESGEAVVVPAILKEAYVYTPGPGAVQITQTGAVTGSLFGVGGIVGTAIMSLLSLWGYIRSRKSLLTASNLAQTVETIREFVKTLPNGAIYDNELVNWMQTHQAEEGALRDVLILLQKHVRNSDAKEAARQIQLTIEALTAAAAKNV